MGMYNHYDQMWVKFESPFSSQIVKIRTEHFCFVKGDNTIETRARVLAIFENAEKVGVDEDGNILFPTEDEDGNILFPMKTLEDLGISRLPSVESFELLS